MFINGNETINIAISEDRSVRFDMSHNIFDEYYYDVEKEGTEIFGSFRFDPHDYVSQSEAYEKAASLYNELVNDEEAIPLF